VKRRGFRELHAHFLKERRTRGHVQGSVQEIRGILLVFREMWDTTNPTLRFSMTHLYTLGSRLLPFAHPQKSLTL
jgi:hypothetical protein